jgi:hypothetical protein
VDLNGAQWRKSSYSTGNADTENCLEVAMLPGGSVAVRDTKDRSQPAQRYPAASWSALLALVKS